MRQSERVTVTMPTDQADALRKLVDAQPIPFRIGQKIVPFDKSLSTQLVVECDMVRRVSRALVQTPQPIRPARLLSLDSARPHHC